MDFITGLPLSSGKTGVDRISEAVYFVALPKLPSAPETAQLLTKHVFELHGILMDAVSDQGPQLTSRVWKESANEELETALHSMVQWS